MSMSKFILHLKMGFDFNVDPKRLKGMIRFYHNNIDYVLGQSSKYRKI